MYKDNKFTPIKTNENDIAKIPNTLENKFNIKFMNGDNFFFLFFIFCLFFFGLFLFFLFENVFIYIYIILKIELINKDMLFYLLNNG